MEAPKAPAHRGGAHRNDAEEAKNAVNAHARGRDWDAMLVKLGRGCRLRCRAVSWEAAQGLLEGELAVLMILRAPAKVHPMSRTHGCFCVFWGEGCSTFLSRCERPLAQYVFPAVCAMLFQPPRNLEVACKGGFFPSTREQDRPQAKFTARAVYHNYRGLLRCADFHAEDVCEVARANGDDLSSTRVCGSCRLSHGSCKANCLWLF
jgi:hypothetical protein